MKRTLREHVKPPLNIGVSTIKGDRVSFRYCNEKYKGKIFDICVIGEHILYSFGIAVSDEGKIIKDILVRDDDILEII